MPKPFDASTKHLLETRPEGWLEYLGLPSGTVEVTDADLSTVTAAADKVLRVLGPSPWLAHIEPQAGPDPALGPRVLEYNVLLDRWHKLPVQSVVLLLRPSADRPRVTGRVVRRLPTGRRYLNFSYEVVRVWEKAVESSVGRRSGNTAAGAAGGCHGGRVAGRAAAHGGTDQS